MYLFKKYLVSVFILLTVYSYSDDFNIEDFFKYPFKESNELFFPEIIDDINTIIDALEEPVKLDVKDKINKYDENSIDKIYTISNSIYWIRYYYISIKKIYYRQLIQISNYLKELKYGIVIGMTEEELLKICGEYSSRNDFENNYELCYFGDAMNQVNFSFSNGILNAINFWISP